MVVELPLDHHCPWRELCEQMRGRLEGLGEIVAAQQTLLAEQRELGQEREAQHQALDAKIAELERRLLGPSSEKLPPIERELDQELSEEERARRREQAAAKRRERTAARKTSMPTERTEHPVADADKHCPVCGGATGVFSRIGFKESTTYDYVPGHFVRRVHARETVACRCGQCVLTAPVPDKVTERGLYESGFIAWLVVSKCVDSLPIYRVEKQLGRLGVPISRSTMNDLLHQAAEALGPLVARLRERIAQMPVVLADETSIKIADRKKRGFVWVFHGRDPETDQELALYVLATTRSGETPVQILGGTEGTLLVDGYTGYNDVTDPEGRGRGGCWSHSRRRFFAARETAPEDANEAMATIRKLFRIEHDAFEREVVRTPAHQRMRDERSRPILEAFREWLTRKRHEYLPKSPMGQAIGYTLRQWPRLTHFLQDPRIPIHNNASESRLRVVALGRKNFMFVGHPKAGRNIAALYSILGSCISCGVEPTAYLTDVLPRVRHATTPAELDALLPDRWIPRSSN